MIITCRQLVERVTDAREGRLSAVDRAGYAVHLGWCANCRRYVAQIDATIAALRRAVQDAALPRPAPEALRASVIARWHERRRG